MQRIRLKARCAGGTPAPGSRTRRIYGILVNGEAMPPDPSADQARTAIQAALGQIGFALPGSITIRHARCGKPRCACAADPPCPARPLHPVDPHRPRQDRHPAAHPGPVPVLRSLVRQRPPAPGTGRRTGSPVPGRNGQSRRLGHDHPRHPGAAPHPPRPRPEPELPQTTQNAGRSARLTREQPSRRTSLTAGHCSSVVGPLASRAIAYAVFAETRRGWAPWEAPWPPGPQSSRTACASVRPACPGGTRRPPGVSPGRWCWPG